MMDVATYLSFKGDCEAAFRFYAESLGGEMGALFYYGGSPMEHMAPSGWQNKVMHGSVKVANQVLMGADVEPEKYEEPKGFSLSLQIKGVDNAERVFGELAKGGRIQMPLEKTFWAARFGMVVDRFGIPWLINCEDTE